MSFARAFASLLGLTLASVPSEAAPRRQRVPERARQQQQSPQESAQGRMDTGFLKGQMRGEGDDAKAKPQERSSPKGGTKSKRIALEEKRAEAQTLSQAAETVNSFTLILKKTPKGARRNALLLNHASALNLYARLKIIAAANAQEQEKVKQYLQVSIRDAQEVLASPQRTPDQVLKAHDIAGTSYLYLDQNLMAREQFLEVLKLNPKPDKAGRIGLMVAEDLFDEGKFKEASGFYAKYYPNMSPQWKELALYKLGWCMMNLDQPDKAEVYLARVAKSQSSSGVGKDAIRDLAYLVTHRSDPMGSLGKVERYFTSPEDKLEFLHNVRISFENQGAIAPHTAIVARLLQMEPNSEKRLELALSNLRVQRKLYASLEHMQAFDQAVERLRKLSQKEFKEAFPKYESVFETETQTLMKSFIDTYAGRIKSPEPISRQQIAEALKRQFKFYNQYFSAKPNYSNVIGLWSDMCLDFKDWACVDEVSQLILSKQDRLGMYTERAYLDQIAALDQFLASPDKTTDRPAIAARRNQRVKEFIERFKKSPQWLRVAKLYTQVETDAGHYKEAMPVLEQILGAEPTEDSFYRFQYARFKLGEHQALLSDARNKKYLQPGSKMADLYRESSLILAQKAKEEGNAEQYKSHISEFVALSTDASKARIARIDYLNFLLKEDTQPKAVEALKEFFSLPASESKNPEFEPLRVELWKRAVAHGRLDSALKLTGYAPDTAEWRQRRLLSTFFVGKIPSMDELGVLSANEREYFLGLIALVQPGWIIRSFKALKRSLSPVEKDLLALSYKLELDQWNLVRTPKLEQALGRGYPFYQKPVLSELAIEKRMEGIRFPDLGKLSPAQQGRAVQDAVLGVRGRREKVASSIQGKAPQVQLRVLEKAKALEARTAEYILSSPVPKELSPEQVAEYRNGLKTAADEFSQQSQQFEVLAKTLREQIEKETKWAESRVLPQPNMSEWDWPSSYDKHPQVRWVQEAFKAKNVIGALALLDYFRAKHLDDEGDFFAIRSGILLTRHPTQAMRIYILEELEKNNQSGILKAWAKSVDRPAPEPRPEGKSGS